MKEICAGGGVVEVCDVRQGHLAAKGGVTNRGLWRWDLLAEWKVRGGAAGLYRQ